MSSLTVAIPALNEEKNVSLTIASVLSAAAKAAPLTVEIIVVDDGSTDRTAAVVEDLARRHSNVHLLRNPGNLGLGASIRRAIAESRSERFIVVPGDNDLPAATLELIFDKADAATAATYFLNEEIRGRMRYLISEAFRVVTRRCSISRHLPERPGRVPGAKLRELELTRRASASSRKSTCACCGRG
jgi:glycosyltransferase involved in cell wall biosynthesis